MTIKRKLLTTLSELENQVIEQAVFLGPGLRSYLSGKELWMTFRNEKFIVIKAYSMEYGELFTAKDLPSPLDYSRDNQTELIRLGILDQVEVESLERIALKERMRRQRYDEYLRLKKEFETA